MYFEGGKAPESAVFDKVLVAVGREPNGKVIGGEAVGVPCRSTSAGSFPWISSSVPTWGTSSPSATSSVGDLQDAPRLAAELPRDGVEVRPLNHRERGTGRGGGGAGGAGGASGVIFGETPSGSSAMVCHSDVYQG